MSWVSPEAWSQAEPDPLREAAAHIIAHMNDDHADTLARYCRVFTRATAATEARMTGVDRYGFEMSVTTDAGPRPIRLAFPESLTTSDEVRRALVAMAKEARAREAG